jgi:hypothetical protein
VRSWLGSLGYERLLPTMVGSFLREAMMSRSSCAESGHGRRIDGLEAIPIGWRLGKGLKPD